MSRPEPAPAARAEVARAAELDRLVLDLEAAFAGAAAADPDGGLRARVSELLTAYARGARDWRALARFRDERYARHRLARTPAFELLLLCWGAGHESPIHNHEGQDCWMAVLDGDVEEVRYPFPAPGHRGALAPGEARVYPRGGLAYIRDEMGLHLVRPAHGRPGVSLHLYAAPYDHCDVYCPDTGRITRMALEPDSIR